MPSVVSQFLLEFGPDADPAWSETETPAQLRDAGRRAGNQKMEEDSGSARYASHSTTLNDAIVAAHAKKRLLSGG